MKIYELRCQLVLPVTIHEAFRVFEDPYNLARITPPWLNFRINSQSIRMQKGAKIDYSFRWLGLPLHWRTIISQYEPPFHFVDEALESPYVLWRHHHGFCVAGDGTEVSDRVEYAMPFGVIGSAVNQIIVARQLRRIFEFRQRAIIAMLGSGVLRIDEPEITVAT
jgi:ligand-binding SRPBCC domain-containing protein